MRPMSTLLHALAHRTTPCVMCLPIRVMLSHTNCCRLLQPTSSSERYDLSSPHIRRPSTPAGFTLTAAWSCIRSFCRTPVSRAEGSCLPNNLCKGGGLLGRLGRAPRRASCHRAAARVRGWGCFCVGAGMCGKGCVHSVRQPALPPLSTALSSSRTPDNALLSPSPWSIPTTAQLPLFCSSCVGGHIVAPPSDCSSLP